MSDSTIDTLAKLEQEQAYLIKKSEEIAEQIERNEKKFITLKQELRG